MLRLSRLLRLQSTIKTYSKEIIKQMRSEIDAKLMKSRNLEMGSDILAHENLNLYQKVYGLSVLDEKYANKSLEGNPKAIYKVFDQIKQNIKSLDPLSLLEFTQFLSKHWETELFRLNKDIDKKNLIDQTNELFSSFTASQLISLFKSLNDIKVNIKMLNDEIEKIVIMSPNDLSVKQISEIISGYGNRNFTTYKYVLDVLLERLSKFKISEIDCDSALRILEALTFAYKNAYNKILINDFLRILEPSMRYWNDYQLLSAASILSRIELVPIKLTYSVWSEILKILEANENLDISFHIKVLKIKLQKDRISPYMESCKLALDLALKAEHIGENDYLQILESAKAELLSYENALLLKSHLKNIQFRRPQNFFKVIKYSSLLTFQSDGKIYSMDSLISLFDLPLLSSSSIPDNFFEKIMILDNILTTKNYENKILKKYADDILNQISMQCSNDFWIKQFITAYNRCFDFELSTATIQFLKPLNKMMQSSLISQIIGDPDDKTLLCAINVLGPDSEEWQHFKKKYDPLFTQNQIYHAIECLNKSFAKINEILSIPELQSPGLLKSAASKIHIATTKEFNDFLIILNKYPAKEFISKINLILIPELSHKISLEGDLSLMSELFEKCSTEIYQLNSSEFKNEAIWRFLYLMAQAQKLNENLANKIISNTDINFKQKHYIYPVIQAASNQERVEQLLKESLLKGTQFQELINAIKEILANPRKEFIDEILINEINKRQFNYSNFDLFCFNRALQTLENRKQEYKKLFDCLVNLFVDAVNKNIRKLDMNEVVNLFELIKYDWSDKLNWNGISEHLISGPERDKIVNWNPTFTNKLVQSGFYNKTIFDILLNGKLMRYNDPFYGPEHLSCLADIKPMMRHNDNGNAIAKNLIDVATMKMITFRNNISTIKWLYGIMNFKSLESEIERHYLNSKEFEIKELTFKHILVENYIALNCSYLKPDLDLQHCFDFLSYFGFNRGLLSSYKLLFEKGGFEVKENEFVNNIWVPLYLVKKRIALWPVSNKIWFYGTNVLRGEFCMHKQHIKQMCENVAFLPQYEENMENADPNEILKKFKLRIE
ncbi:unnamed protein product [Blepharisma stoltei]|uniref:Uncharacterized protein n=1 Tax=Blepharisma stoltei TaxID=1481888 RepID=A0AAU9IEA9_9CILI|nr:unnamed protein product [Blepharisma stoltei]